MFRQDAVEMQEQCGFAGAVRTDEPHALAFREREADIPERFRSIGIEITQALDVQGIHVFQPRAHMAA